jgi:ATP-dependent Clp protease protease subunit
MQDKQEIRLYGGARGGGGKSRRGDGEFYSVYSPFEVSAARSHAMHFNIYLFGPIMDASQFIGPMEVLQAAGEGDLVELHLSTPGGCMDSTDTFLQALRECEGRVVVRATGGVHSCGSIILMNAPEFSLSENFNSLIHNGSTGGYGDLNKFAASSKHSVDYMNKVLRKTYEGFLTPDELNAMIDGKDFWLDGAEWMRRFKMRQDHFRGRMQDSGMLERIDDDEPEVEVTPRPPARKRVKRPAQ